MLVDRYPVFRGYIIINRVALERHRTLVRLPHYVFTRFYFYQERLLMVLCLTGNSEQSDLRRSRHPPLYNHPTRYFSYRIIDFAKYPSRSTHSGIESVPGSSPFSSLTQPAFVREPAVRSAQGDARFISRFTRSWSPSWVRCYPRHNKHSWNNSNCSSSGPSPSIRLFPPNPDTTVRSILRLDTHPVSGFFDSQGCFLIQSGLVT